MLLEFLLSGLDLSKYLRDTEWPFEKLPKLAANILLINYYEISSLFNKLAISSFM
ncbi:hypothetical protein HYE28_00835 [Mycoplasmopsis bovis]|nr:hypothetical protein [Mycoplasmopsis bovis]QQH22951.1 hypothetical protein HYE28_00835 [Mycoplasmopsis bovis]